MAIKNENDLVPLQQVMDEALKNPQVRAAYDAIEIRRAMLAQLKQARQALNLTQEDIAEKTGMKKQNISRMENGVVSPNLETVARYAQAVGGMFVFHSFSEK